MAAERDGRADFRQGRDATQQQQAYCRLTDTGLGADGVGIAGDAGASDPDHDCRGSEDRYIEPEWCIGKIEHGYRKLSR